MEEWSADFANNPNDDYNLVVEILHCGQDVAVIFQNDSNLLLKIYPQPESINIPVDWLNGLLKAAQQRLGQNHSM